MDNIFCIIGTASLFIAVVTAFFSETTKGSKDSKKDESSKSTAKISDTYSYVCVFAIVAVICFILFGFTLFLNGYLW